MSAMPPVGVLALQGDYDAHAKALARCGAAPLEIRRVAQLDGLAGLVIPGGESSTLLNLMRDEPWFEALRAFHARGASLFGTCAGAILLSREVRHPAQESLALLDATIERNAYGRQVDSFETDLAVSVLAAPLGVAFIRAPRFVQLGAGVEVLAAHADAPVLVREGRVVAATFHPEITGADDLHAWWLGTLA
ncbi:MAG: pyridoxal 5'-phosphate synthase glutaminase subunit PdxT [Vicinamibacteria bacterium]|nr:pyridoxal 5'-phosphate synthase glutaminase subunit PdxT [Vicinamibacteria bacterium]